MVMDPLTIELDGKPYRLNGPMQFSGLKTFPPKVVTGDYSLENNPLLSTWVLSDFSGGHGVQDLNEATDTNRYRYGDINTRFPKQFTLPFQYNYGQFGSSTDSYAPVGNMLIGGAYKYLSALNTDLRADEVSLGLTALPANPIRRGGVVYGGAGANDMMFIPLGVNGYAVYDPVAAVVTPHTGAGNTFKDFVVWDDKLIGIDATGQLRYTTAAAAAPTWTSYGATAKAPNVGSGNFVLAPYVNQQGDPAVHVLGEQGVWIFDADGPKLWRLNINLPSRINVRSNMCTWRGDLYLSAGMDVIQWNGSVERPAVSLARDDGIPYELQGEVVDLYPELNSLYALVLAEDQSFAKTGYLSVHEWSGYGWRALPMPTQGLHKDVTHLSVMNSATLGYKLVLGTQGFNTSPNSANRMRWFLPIGFTNPRASLEAGVIPFGASPSTPFVVSDNGSAYFETGKFDANMEGVVKVAADVTVTFSNNSTSNDPAKVYYRLENDTSYTLLGSVPNAAPGTYVLPFGTVDANGIYPGMPFRDIELKVVLAGGVSDYTTPVLRSMVLSYLKQTDQSYSWTANIDLMSPDNGRSPEVILEDLKALTAQGEFFTMLHRDLPYRVQIAQIQGLEHLASDERATVQLSIIQIPELSLS